MHAKVKKIIDGIQDNDETLTEINLADLGLTDADIAPLMAALNSNLNAAQRITSLDLSGNNLSIMINPFIMDTLTFLDVRNNQIKVFETAMINALNESLNGNLGLEGNPVTAVMLAKMCRLGIFGYAPLSAENITNEGLKEHFQVLLENRVNGNEKSQKVLNVLARTSVKLPSELVNMVFDFLENDHGKLVSEINILKTLFPEHQNIITSFENSAEFKAIEKSYYEQTGSSGAPGAKATADARAMKALLNYYRQCDKYTANFNYLRNDNTRLNPNDNPFQVSLRPPKI